jgi:hypothetical protein
MPIAAAIPAIAGGILGGIGGATNTRPPSLDPTQRGTLDSLLKTLSGTVGATPKIDPEQQANLFGQVAQSGVGGANRIVNALSSRGLGRSGLLASGLTQNSNQISANQTAVNQQLQQQAINQRNTTIQQILGLLGVSNIPGQSGVGGFFSGAAGPLSYGLSKLRFGGGAPNYSQPDFGGYSGQPG